MEWRHHLFQLCRGTVIFVAPQSRIERIRMSDTVVFETALHQYGHMQRTKVQERGEADKSLRREQVEPHRMASHYGGYASQSHQSYQINHRITTLASAFYFEYHGNFINDQDPTVLPMSPEPFSPLDALL